MDKKELRDRSYEARAKEKTRFWTSRSAWDNAVLEARAYIAAEEARVKAEEEAKNKSK